MKQDKYPLISVITVVLNNVNFIEETILSVVDQTYPFVEYIVIDGSSTDGTIDVINKFKSRITKVVSEPDRGLYDAMNKGSRLCNGEWVIFMNSGDKFYNEKVLENIFSNGELALESRSIIYSKAIARYHTEDVILKTRKLKYIWMGPPTSHQCQIISSSLVREKSFNLKFKINADYDFVYHCYMNNTKFVYLNNEYIAICSAVDGISKTSSAKRILIENFIVSRQYSTNTQLFLLFNINVLKYLYAQIKRFKSCIWSY